MQVSIGSRPYSLEAFTSKPSRLGSQPSTFTDWNTKRIEIFSKYSKILKTSRTNMLKSLITNINLFFLF
jgi:hypothetical protein